MVEEIDIKFVRSWGSIEHCKDDDCTRRGLRLTEPMYYSSATENHYCKFCRELYYSDNNLITPKSNDAKFKCPEGSCNSSLSFHEFFARTCCIDAMKNSKDCGLSSEDQKHRVEFQDLKKMMNLLEFSETRTNDTRKDKDLKCKKYEDALAVYVDKKEKREESQKVLAAVFKDAESFIGRASGPSSSDATNQKFCELKTLMDEHQKMIREEGEAEKTMESEKTIFEKSKSEFAREEEKRDEIQSELSLSLTDVGQALAKKEEVEKNGRDKCNVCFEKYNTIDRHFCVLQCGHPTCQKCLSEIPEKLCPICREPFTENNIIKLFFN